MFAALVASVLTGLVLCVGAVAAAHHHVVAAPGKLLDVGAVVRQRHGAAVVPHLHTSHVLQAVTCHVSRVVLQKVPSEFYPKVCNSVLNVKAVVAAFNQEKALVGAFSVITNLRIKFGWNFLKHYS